MARERMVTRTINAVEVTALCVYTDTAQTEFQLFDLTGMDATDTDGILKALKRSHDTEYFKVVAVTQAVTREELYGMSELDFLKYAYRLDPETRKPINA